MAPQKWAKEDWGRERAKFLVLAYAEVEGYDEMRREDAKKEFWGFYQRRIDQIETYMLSRPDEAPELPRVRKYMMLSSGTPEKPNKLTFDTAWNLAKRLLAEMRNKVHPLFFRLLRQGKVGAKSGETWRVGA